MGLSFPTISNETLARGARHGPAIAAVGIAAAIAGRRVLLLTDSLFSATIAKFDSWRTSIAALEEIAHLVLEIQKGEQHLEETKIFATVAENALESHLRIYLTAVVSERGSRSTEEVDRARQVYNQYTDMCFRQTAKLYAQRATLEEGLRSLHTNSGALHDVLRTERIDERLCQRVMEQFHTINRTWACRLDERAECCWQQSTSHLGRDLAISAAMLAICAAFEWRSVRDLATRATRAIWPPPERPPTCPIDLESCLERVHWMGIHGSHTYECIGLPPVLPIGTSPNPYYVPPPSTLTKIGRWLWSWVPS